jgi:hypothetical protein
VPRSQDADRSEEPQAVSQTRATDAESLGQFAFGRKSITGLEAALPDHVANLANDLFGDQSGFFWSDHPKPAQTNCAILVPSHRLDDSLAANGAADKTARIVAHFHCVTSPNRNRRHPGRQSLTRP